MEEKEEEVLEEEENVLVSVARLMLSSVHTMRLRSYRPKRSSLVQIMALRIHHKNGGITRH